MSLRNLLLSCLHSFPKRSCHTVTRGLISHNFLLQRFHFPSIPSLRSARLASPNNFYKLHLLRPTLFYCLIFFGCQDPKFIQTDLKFFLKEKLTWADLKLATFQSEMEVTSLDHEPFCSLTLSREVKMLMTLLEVIY